MSTEPIAAGPNDVTVMQQFVGDLSGVMAAKQDAVLKEAVTRFLGRSDWNLEDLKGRVVMQHWANGIEVFCLDGVPLVELQPIMFETEHKGGNTILHATRQHRVLLA
jgi:hypothetical protein